MHCHCAGEGLVSVAHEQVELKLALLTSALVLNATPSEAVLVKVAETVNVWWPPADLCGHFLGKCHFFRRKPSIGLAVDPIECHPAHAVRIVSRIDVRPKLYTMPASCSLPRGRYQPRPGMIANSPRERFEFEDEARKGERSSCVRLHIKVNCRGRDDWNLDGCGDYLGRALRALIAHRHPKQPEQAHRISLKSWNRWAFEGRGCSSQAE